MKKLLTLLMAMMLMVMPALGAAEESSPETSLTLADLLAAAEVSPEEDSIIEDLATKALNAGRKVDYSLTLSDWPSGITGDESIDAMINDVLDALVITVSQQGDEGAFALKMSGNDLLTIGVATSGEDAYINSNLLGGTIVISGDEVEPIVTRLVDMFALMGLFEEADVEEIKAQLPAILDTVEQELSASSFAALTEEDVMNLDVSAIVEALAPILSKMEAGELTGQPKNCDQAASVVTFTITPDEMKAVSKSLFLFIKDNPSLMNYMQQMMESGDMVTADGEAVTFEQLMDQAIAQMDKETLTVEDSVIAMYLDEAGEPVAMNATFNMASSSVSSEDGAETVTTMPLTITYARLTINEGVTHTVTMVAEDASMTLNMLVRDENSFYMSVDFVDDAGEGMHMTVDCVSTVTDTASDATIALDFTINADGETIAFGADVVSKYTMNGVDFTGEDVIDVTVGDMKVLTIKLNTQTSDAGQSIMSGEVVRPAELNDTDFANWFVGIVNNLQSWLGTAMMSLPQSVLQLIFSSGMM
ncbi:MAG: hypothetical protein IJZ74_03880 [Clostridia bacterium]|nr:hypothetical protein [Clostridia bacterium]